jgi:hypothetical protein
MDSRRTEAQQLSDRAQMDGRDSSNGRAQKKQRKWARQKSEPNIDPQRRQIVQRQNHSMMAGSSRRVEEQLDDLN